MRVALLNNCAPIAGVGVYSFSLLHALERFGDVEARMICTEPFPSNFCDIDDEITFLTGIRFIPVNHVLDYFIFPLRTPKGYDLYHVTTHSLGRFARFSHPSIVTVHDVSALRPEFDAWSDYGRITSYGNVMANTVWRAFHRKSMADARYADLIVCLSEFTRSELMEGLGVSAQRVRVIPHGIDHSLFRPRDRLAARKRIGLPLDKKVILHVGDEGGRKNIPTLIRAFYMLKNRVADAVLVRVGDRREGTRRMIERYGLEESILYTGVLSSHKDVAYFYNAADLLFFPSVYEGFGIPVLEAMASGCPVVASCRAAIPEVVSDAGVLVDPMNVEMLAERIREVIEEEDLRQDLIERGLRRASAFSWERHAEETVELYRKLCD